MLKRDSTFQFRVDIPQVLFLLFCLYGFLLPFESILEFWFGIDTIFKPYRLVNLLIIGVFVIHLARGGVTIRRDIREDIFLYGIFIYGLALSLILMMTAPFQMEHFLNDVFQSSLYLLAFFIFKTLDLTPNQLNRVFQALLLGILLNAVYVFYEFSFLRLYRRASGFMDNPNYVALGLVIALSYCLLKLDRVKKVILRLAFLGIILLLLYVLIITGSRTGLVLLILASLLIFFFVSFWKKVGLVVGTLALGLLLMPRNTSYVDFGGPLILVNRVMSKLDAEEEDVRFFIWRGVMRSLEDTGYLGMGIGQFKANFPRFFNYEPHSFITRIVDRGYFLSTHNDYLAILTDYGLIGLVCYLVFLFLSFRKRYYLLRSPAGSSESRFLYTFSFIVLSCMIVFGMAAENFQNQLFWFLMMFATKTPRDI